MTVPTVEVHLGAEDLRTALRRDVAHEPPRSTLYPEPKNTSEYSR